jgi:Reverse transcriptase (RNA-dependent DNA polymerase)
VAKGFSQIEGIDYDDIFSPVVRYESVCLIVALAALQHWQMSKLPFSMESWTRNSSWNNLRDLKRKAKSTRCSVLNKLSMD